MKVLLFNGSPRPKGNTFHGLNVVKETLEADGIDCDYIWLGEENLNGCKACYQCTQLKKCSQNDDKLNDHYERILKADGIVLGSPTYFGDLTPNMKAFIDRVGLISLLGDAPLKHKIGAGLVVQRKTGGLHAFHSINNLFFASDMFIVGSWNIGNGLKPRDIKNDAEAIKAFRKLGKNFAFLLQKLKE